MPKQAPKMNRKFVRRRRMLLLLIALVIAVLAGVLLFLFLGNKEELPPSESTPAAGMMTEPSVEGDSSPAEPVSSQESESSQEPAPPVESSTPEPQPAVSAPESEVSWELLLVNVKNPLPGSYSATLEDVGGGFQIDMRIATSLKEMVAKAKADGVNLEICSAYRDPVKQSDILEDRIQEYMGYGYLREDAEKAVQREIAKPGISEHQTGLAVDIVTPSHRTLDRAFEDTTAFRWLAENAWEFGFVLRYPDGKEPVTGISYEPWHYRYVGRIAARDIQKGGYCMEEYLYLLQLAEEERASRDAPDAQALLETEQRAGEAEGGSGEAGKADAPADEAK